MLDTDFINWLKDRFDAVRFDEPMSKHTSFRIGGPADAFVTPQNIEELTELVKACFQKNVNYLIIGGGTNLLVKDGGIRGVVITLSKCLKTIAQKDETTKGIIVNAMAGAWLGALCSFTILHGLEGMNAMLGIPGTVGGGIMMNAGTALGSIGNVLDYITVLLPTGKIEKIYKKELMIEYRKLSWNIGAGAESGKGQVVIIEGGFYLTPSDSKKLKQEAEAILKIRNEKQPLNFPSAGCFFKNPPSPHLPMADSGELISAGQLIDRAGLKGKRVGGAEISSKHANFIINRKNASSADVLALMEIVQESVWRQFGIRLQTEVKIVGE